MNARYHYHSKIKKLVAFDMYMYYCGLELFFKMFSFSVEANKNRSNSVDEANMAQRTHLTDFERMLLKTQDLIEIRGKVCTMFFFN